MCIRFQSTAIYFQEPIEEDLFPTPVAETLLEQGQMHAPTSFLRIILMFNFSSLSLHFKLNLGACSMLLALDASFLQILKLFGTKELFIDIVRRKVTAKLTSLTLTARCKVSRDWCRHCHVDSSMATFLTDDTGQECPIPLTGKYVFLPRDAMHPRY